MFLKAQMPDHHLLNGIFSHGGRESKDSKMWVLMQTTTFLPRLWCINTDYEN